MVPGARALSRAARARSCAATISRPPGVRSGSKRSLSCARPASSSAMPRLTGLGPVVRRLPRNVPPRSTASTCAPDAPMGWRAAADHGR